MLVSRRMLQRVANKGTKFIGAHWGESFPMYYICEYPKSGGTWLGRMVSDALQIPFPQHSRLPIAMKSVIHNHWRYNPKLRRVFYLYRDGRDIMVSFYFYRMKRIKANTGSKDLAVYQRLLGKGFDPDDTNRNLPIFIENEFSNPRDARISWVDHINQWYDPENRPHIAYVSYEQLLEDAIGSLRRVTEHLSGEAVDEYRLQMAVEKNSMAKQTGRTPGQEDRSSFVRKGISGDWMNYFNEESSAVFSKYASKTLVKLGYEQSEQWMDQYVFDSSKEGCSPIASVEDESDSA